MRRVLLWIVDHPALAATLVALLTLALATQIPKLEIGTGEVYVYQVDANGKITSKEVRAANPNAGKV